MRAKFRLYAGIAAVSLTGLTAGCRDAGLAPPESHASPSLDLSSGSVSVFVYSPFSGAKTYSLTNSHKISFSARSVCDPVLSTYGTTEWNRPCVPALAPIVITALVSTDADGHPRVDFSPALRFVPGSEVVLYLKDKTAAADSASTINWCGPDGACVDESVGQPTLATKHDNGSGFVYRSIKHFSGYNVSAGRYAAYE